MNARRGAAGLMAAAAMASPASASAQQPDAPLVVVDAEAVAAQPWKAPDYPGMRPATRRSLTLLQAAATKYWDKQGVARVGDPTQLYVADSLMDSDNNPSEIGRATGVAEGWDQNRVYLQRDHVQYLMKVSRDSPFRSNRRQALRELYNLMVHEEGHVRGKEHDFGGPMLTMDVMTPDAMPRGWRPVAKQILGVKYQNPRFWRMTPEGELVKRNRPRPR